MPTAPPTDAGDDGNDVDGNGEPGAFEERYPVNQAFWHQAFKIEIGDAIYAGTEPDLFGGGQEFTLTLEVVITNEGPDQSLLDSSVVLVTPDDTYSARFGTLPTVTGGGFSDNGEFVFSVDDQFEINDAYLVVGSGGEQQARVPIGPGGGELVALEPFDPQITGTMSIELLDLDFTSAQVRADYPSSHTQVEAGKLALTLNFDAASRRSGNWTVFATEFSLTLPDGSTVPVDGYDLPSLPGSDAGLVTEGLFLRFLVDDPANGAYALQFNPSEFWLAEGDPARVTLDFEI